MIVRLPARRAAQAVRRAALLSSVATLGIAGAAQAQQADFAPELAPQTGHVVVAAPDPQIVVADPNTPDGAVDITDINGVGQMIVDQQNGFIGLCTGTLINPRTVLFAAHCVNDRAGSEYGTSSGGVPIGFGFSANNRSGLVNWYFGGHETNTDLAFYNARWVTYNPLSLEPDAATFLYGDVALAALDTPAADIPTWALLFSPLPAQNLGADGTGYHVTITGYGNNGTGTVGSSGGIDFRRRSAENMLGALASLNDFQAFLFGIPDSGLPQNLYFMDFDDPRRGTVDADPRDFNAIRDNATGNEGITASGDSGGPLILDNTFDIDLVIGVLSGGYTRFFGGAPANGYGTVSFYQPLYLYWDWIAANNPYHYVGAKAGDGNWMDPTHWLTGTDPNYFVIGPDGTLLNGVPTTPGAGNTEEEGVGFGEFCFQVPGYNECYDVATGEGGVTDDPIGTGASNSAGTAAVGGLVGQVAPEAQDGVTTAALPAPTIENGLPGASNFVPNNVEGGGTVMPQYYDVTLSQTGTTRLDDEVTIDRLTLTGAGAALDISATGSLTSLMSINQYQGMMRVNGTLSTNGDYMLMFGGLQGSGHIYTPYFTNMAGFIAPGGVGTVGTLAFHGNAILTSGSTLMIDLGNNGHSDRVRVVSTTFDADGNPVDGMASIGGQLVFGAATGEMIRDGNTYTILTAQGGIDGTFDTPAALSAILTPVVTYGPNAVTVEIEAGTYASVINTASAIQTSYAYLLDNNRSAYDQLRGLYGPLDLQNQATIRSTLEALAPRAHSLIGPMGLAFGDTLAQLRRDRIGQFERGTTGGTLAQYGRPLEMAAANDMMRANSAEDGEPMVTENALPENISVYLAGGYVTGDAMAMGGVGRNDFDGWYGSIGLEAALGDYSMVGGSVSYAESDGEVNGFAQSADANLYQLALYGKVGSKSGLTIDGQFSMGIWDVATQREVGFLGTPYTVRAQKDASLVDAEIGVSMALGAMGGFQLTPRAAFRETWLEVGQYREVGAPFALQSDFPTYRNEQARLGLTLDKKGRGLRPYINATYVHDFADKPALFAAGFTNGTEATAPFALAGTDHDWGEISGKISYDTGALDLALMAKTTVWRDDLSVQSYSASATLRF